MPPEIDAAYAAVVAEKTAIGNAKAAEKQAKIDVIRATGAKNAARVVKMGQIIEIEKNVDKDRAIVRRAERLDLPPDVMQAYADELRKKEEESWFAALNEERRERGY